ncbi:hypothetical protein LNA01_15420 [Companilactobacillus nantensis]|uniref:Uncharacterized protein n=1 Tax=Companilactobacillus nantensis DSM 16982 TaxID=1423774 RepID=A0A0R1WC92_9LACO|nr:hypothetical protein FD31_GL001188 [Companilactobacillus nantensis DSM 16982]GEO64359.1 hypothetical protein LNA01_15420 [Companilactobacillus nantensis]
MSIDVPFWEDEIVPKLLDGKNVIIATHAVTHYVLSLSTLKTSLMLTSWMLKWLLVNQLFMLG